MSAREVIRCPHCRLNQFRTESGNCRRCHANLDPGPLLAEPAVIPVASDQAPPARHGEEEARRFAEALRTSRQVRKLTQAQMAIRIGCPRTYINKIEMGKCLPTLKSIDRIATALGMEAAALVNAALAHASSTSVVMADEFLRELAGLLPQLSFEQRAVVLNTVRDMARRVA